MAVFVQGQDHHAPPGQLDGVGGVGLPIVLVAVEEQHARGLVLRRGGLGRVELVGHPAQMLFSVLPPIGVDDALRNGDVAVVGLDGVGDCQRPKGDDEQHGQQNGPFGACFFHTNPSSFMIVDNQNRTPLKKGVHRLACQSATVSAGAVKEEKVASASSK